MATVKARITKVEHDVGTGWYTISTDHESVKRLTTKMEQKAKESGGDFNRLSPEDQRRLFLTQGQMAPFLFKQAAQKAQK